MSHGGRVLIAILILLVSSASVTAGVTNGSLEPGVPFPTGYLAVGGGSNQIAGWTTLHTGVEWFHPSFNDLPTGRYSDSPDGGYAVDLANLTFSLGGIAQELQTVPGWHYRIWFYLGTHTPL